MRAELEFNEGKGGTWGVANDRGLVLIKFERAGDDVGIFQCQLTPQVAVAIAQALVRNAMRAGHGGPIEFTLGDPTQ